MTKYDISVGDLVAMIERGELRLPEMQRRYVWRATRVRDLLDSLYRGYPSGSILVWETNDAPPSRDLALAQHRNPFATNKLLLDGQQRLTSLAAVLNGKPVRVRGRERPIEILFNLDHPENLTQFTEVDADTERIDAEPDEELDENGEEEQREGAVLERIRNLTFVVASRALSQRPNWVPVSEVFESNSDSEILRRAGVTALDDPRCAQYQARLQKLRAIRNYQYSMHLLPRNLSYEEVAEIFVRVNSLGMKLRGSDLALAQITARWPNSLELLERFQEECEERWITLDLGLLVRAMVVFATGQSRFKTVASTAIDRLRDGWERAKDGLRFAINFLHTNGGIEDESLLSSPLFFIAVAYFAHQRRQRLTTADERELLYWLHVANAKGHYSGSSETVLDADLALMARDGSAGDLAATLERQVGRLGFVPEDFSGRSHVSPMYSLVFLALRARGAKDWATGLRISLTHQGRCHFIQHHHVFPKALLKELYEKKEINEIANLAFISGGTNRSLGKRPPAEYLPEIVERRGRDALDSQGVPTDRALWQLDRFRGFLGERRRLLCEIVNEFLESGRQQ